MFGFCAAAWNKAKLRGEIKPRRPGLPLQVLLRRRGSRHNVKKRLLREGLIRNQCDECGLSEWRGKALIVHIDHINGVKNDHRLETFACSARTATARRRPTAPGIGSYSACCKTGVRPCSITVAAVPVGETVSRLPLEQFFLVRIEDREFAALSSRGLGRCPLTAVTRVRLPLGLPILLPISAASVSMAFTGDTRALIPVAQDAAGPGKMKNWKRWNG